MTSSILKKSYYAKGETEEIAPNWGDFEVSQTYMYMCGSDVNSHPDMYTYIPTLPPNLSIGYIEVRSIIVGMY